jgi:hypothetical protein
MTSLKKLTDRRRRDLHFNACERAMKAQQALDDYFRELEKRDPKLKGLLAESDEAEDAVRRFHG